MNIKKARVINSMTQQEVANKLGIERTSYARYENESREPDIRTICALADLFNVTTDYLIGRTDIPNIYRNYVKVGTMKPIEPKQSEAPGPLGAQRAAAESCEQKDLRRLEPFVRKIVMEILAESNDA